jgi:hypothetical protein
MGLRIVPDPIGHLGGGHGLRAAGGSTVDPTISDDFAADSGLWLDGALAAAAMSVATSKGIWSPTFLNELITNGSMETGDPPSSWTAVNCTLSRVSDERTGGAGSYSLGITRTAASLYARQSPTSIGKWQCISLYGKVIDGVSVYAKLQTSAFQTNTITSTNWERGVATGIAANASEQLRVLSNATTNDQVVLVDDVSVKTYTESSLWRVQPIPEPFYVEAQIWRTGLTQKGVTLYKDASNYILLYLDGGSNIILRKCVAGTLSASLGTGTITYSGGGKLRLAPNAAFTAFTCYYGDVAILSDVAIADFTGMTGDWYAGLFSTINEGSLAIDAFAGFIAGPT